MRHAVFLFRWLVVMKISLWTGSTFLVAPLGLTTDARGSFTNRVSRAFTPRPRRLVTTWPFSCLGQNACPHLRPEAGDTEPQETSRPVRGIRTTVYVFCGPTVRVGAVLPARSVRPKAVRPVTTVTLAAGLTLFGVGNWISKAGDQIRPPEFWPSPGQVTLTSVKTNKQTKGK